MFLRRINNISCCFAQGIYLVKVYINKNITTQKVVKK
jgi:hypothetical protein